MRFLKFFIFLVFLVPLSAQSEDREYIAYDFEFISIEGKPMPLAEYKGKVLLVVNIASECGFASQLEGLERLWKQYAVKGLVVIGVPSNDFKQESKDEKEIKRFCEQNFGVTFPLTARNKVTGKDAHPFFIWANDETATPKWNYYKYLIAKDGKIVDHFSTFTGPESDSIKEAIEEQLKK